MKRLISHTSLLLISPRISGQRKLSTHWMLQSPKKEGGTTRNLETNVVSRSPRAHSSVILTFSSQRLRMMLIMRSSMLLLSRITLFLRNGWPVVPTTLFSVRCQSFSRQYHPLKVVLWTHQCPIRSSPMSVNLDIRHWRDGKLFQRTVLSVATSSSAFEASRALQPLVADFNAPTTRQQSRNVSFPIFLLSEFRICLLTLDVESSLTPWTKSFSNFVSRS